MEKVLFVLLDLPIWAYIGAGGLALAIICFFIIRAIIRNRFRERLEEIKKNPEKVNELILDHYSPSRLLRYSGIVEKKAEEEPKLPKQIGIDELWLERFRQRRNTSDFRRIVKFAPEKGLFSCFLAALEKSRYARMLLEWLKEHEEMLVLRRLALPGKGEEFDGKAALGLFQEHIDEVREMMGDPEWAVRYFAVKILLYDDDERSEQSVAEAFHDPYPLVRKTVVEEYKHSSDGDAIYTKLKELFLNDPIFEVRKAAIERIRGEFPHKHSIDLSSLNTTQALHALELLDLHSDHDINIAFTYLDSNNLELRFPAAQFLGHLNSLDRLILDVDFSDKEKLERNLSLLSKACEVNVTSFLSKTETTESAASLYIASMMLRYWGDRSHIDTLADRVFNLGELKPEYQEIYQNVVECISERGDDVALEHLERELNKKRNDERKAALILKNIPKRGVMFFASSLLDFLKDPSFKARDELRDALVKLPVPFILPELITIIKEPRVNYPHVVRKDALKTLGGLELKYCVQFLLEHLPVLPLDEAREFSTILSEFTGKVFDERVDGLLNSADSTVRASLIASLPATGRKNFLKQIREALSDADPDVRIASVWSLKDFEDTRTINQIHDMLRDPVKRVRVAVAEVIGIAGSEQSIEHLKDLLFDENEVEPVKKAAITGLSASSKISSVDIMVEKLAADEEMDEEIQKGLAAKTGKAGARQLIEHFKDGEQTLRTKISTVFALMKQRGADLLYELLQEDIPSLKPLIAQVLEENGFIEAAIRKLKDRNVETRREGARFLASIENESAFRGIVLAARDPDQEVRVQVIRALEQLNTNDGKKILNSLENDPDKRVRKYTYWALERIKAKAL